MKQRVYIDTSVIGGCEDEEFSEWSLKLFNDFTKGLKIAVVSDLTRRELEGAPENVKKRLLSLPIESIENVSLSEEAESLAQKYIDEIVVTNKHIIDAQHIAIATLEHVNVLVSWNFQQIVNLNKIHAFNAINLKSGYPILEIRSPREIIYEEEI
jgi:hypothetical protein